ncbi:MAG: histidine phosphatase family protein [Chloroflexota bacterium]|nr:histidine phosphatase family protein [Chloroflexota bacterium]
MNEVELYLLRHADAGDPAAWRGDDRARPLSDKGRRQASSLGRFLGRRGFVPDAVLSSPRMRARQTAQMIADALKVEIDLDDRLAGPLDLEVLSGVLSDVDRRRVMLVGHDPDFSQLAAQLTGAAELSLSKGGLARIDAALPLRAGAGVLRWLLPADLVG